MIIISYKNKMKTISILYLIFLMMLLKINSKEFLRYLTTCPTPIKTNTDILATAATYVILAGSAITFNGASTMSGNVGVDPTNAINGPNAPPAFNCGALIPTGDPGLVQAKKDLQTAYDYLSAKVTAGSTALTVIANLNIKPGVYTMAATTVDSIILDNNGDPDAVWIIQCTSTLITNPNATVTMKSGGNYLNVWWQVVSSVTFASNTRWMGNLIINITMTCNSNCSFIGRALAISGAITAGAMTCKVSSCPD